jgi:hypothetical protein
MLFAGTGAMRRAARRRREEELARQARDEAGGGSALDSPFAGMPLGSLFEQMMRGRSGMAGGGATAVTHEDVTEALTRFRGGAAARESYV